MMLSLAGLVLVTDAIAAMGLPPGRHSLGQQTIQIQGPYAYVAGPLHRKNTLSFLLSRHVFHLWSGGGFESLFSRPFQGLCWCLSGTDTLSGSIATMDTCVRHFRQASGQTALRLHLHPSEPRQKTGSSNCVSRLQRGGGSGSGLAPPGPAAGPQPQEGKAGLRFRRRSASVSAASRTDWS